MLKFHRYEPAPELKGYIHGYWEIKASNLKTLDLVPDGHPELAILFRPGCQAKAGLYGQLTHRSTTTFHPGDRDIYVKLYPWTAYLLFKTPCNELLDTVTDLNGLTSDPELRQLIRDIGSMENMMEVCAAFDCFFIKKLELLQYGNPFINYAVRQIFQTYGTTSIESLTSNIHASRRYVEKVFKKQIGVSPKQYARLIRIKKASLIFLNENFNENISHVSAQLEYYDQSHFLKDFKAVVHCTPTEFLRQQGNLPLDGKEDYLKQWDYS